MYFELPLLFTSWKTLSAYVIKYYHYFYHYLFHISRQRLWQILLVLFKVFYPVVLCCLWTTTISCLTIWSMCKPVNHQPVDIMLAVIGRNSFVCITDAVFS